MFPWSTPVPQLPVIFPIMVGRRKFRICTSAGLRGSVRLRMRLLNLTGASPPRKPSGRHGGVAGGGTATRLLAVPEEPLCLCWRAWRACWRVVRTAGPRGCESGGVAAPRSLLGSSNGRALLAGTVPFGQEARVRHAFRGVPLAALGGRRSRAASQPLAPGWPSPWPSQRPAGRRPKSFGSLAPANRRVGRPQRTAAYRSRDCLAFRRSSSPPRVH